MFAFLGIDLDYLLVRLNDGHRLSCPENCPNSISGLITECFLKDPRARPGFGVILNRLVDAYEELNESHRSKTYLVTNEGHPIYTIPIHKSINDDMKNQYDKLLKQNTNLQADVDEEVTQKGELQNGSIHYASLEKIEVLKREYRYSLVQEARE